MNVWSPHDDTPQNGYPEYTERLISALWRQKRSSEEDWAAKTICDWDDQGYLTGGVHIIRVVGTGSGNIGMSVDRPGSFTYDTPTVTIIDDSLLALAVIGPDFLVQRMKMFRGTPAHWEMLQKLIADGVEHSDITQNVDDLVAVARERMQRKETTN